MKIIFFGTPTVVLPILEILQRNFRTKDNPFPIRAVVTQPPKPVGRKKIRTFSPVDNWAYSHKIPAQYDFANLPSADLGICAAFGKIIPSTVINNLKFGILNIHPSLLPKYRGASPVQAAILAGEKQTGVTIIKMDEKMDHGPILCQFKEDILDSDTSGSLQTRLFNRAAEVLVSFIPAYIQGKINPKIQDESQASYTSLLKKEDGFIPPFYFAAALDGQKINEKWSIPFVKGLNLIPNPSSLDQFIRAMDPWPTAWTLVKVKGEKQKTPLRLKILKCHLEEEKLKPETVQLESKKPVNWKEFTQAYPDLEF